jgi:hypothetical protein
LNNQQSTPAFVEHLLLTTCHLVASPYWLLCSSRPPFAICSREKVVLDCAN